MLPNSSPSAGLPSISGDTMIGVSNVLLQRGLGRVVVGVDSGFLQDGTCRSATCVSHSGGAHRVTHVIKARA